MVDVMERINRFISEYELFTFKLDKWLTSKNWELDANDEIALFKVYLEYGNKLK